MHTKWIALLGSLTLLAACADRKEAAREILTAQLPEKRYVEFQDMVQYPDGAVCGEFRTTDPMRGSTRYRPFVVWGDQAEERPTAQDLAIFCSRDAAAALQATYGIGPLDDPANHLPQLRADIRQLDNALQAYALDNHFMPSTEQGLAALITPSAIRPLPVNFREGGYLEQLPVDPWGRPYQYERSGLGGVAHDYRLYTLGADGQPGGSGADADVGSEHSKYLDYLAP